MDEGLVKVIGHRTRAEENMLLRRYVALTLIGLFVFNSVCAMSCIFLIGFGLMQLSNTIIHYLMTQTIGEGAAIILLLTRSLFPLKPPVNPHNRCGSGHKVTGMVS
jgi:hypothetical protein